MITKKHRTPFNTVHGAIEDMSLAIPSRHSEPISSLEMSSQLQHDQSVKMTQTDSPVKPILPCTLIDIMVLQSYIMSSADITPERENVLTAGGVPEEDGNGRNFYDVDDAVTGPSTMNMDLHPLKHSQSTSVTAMMM